MTPVCWVLLSIGLFAVVILIFCSDWLPSWMCDYLGHSRPKNRFVPKNGGSVLIGKCSRCGKHVQNDTDYPNDVWY